MNNKEALKEKFGLTHNTEYLNNFGKLQLELIEKGRDYILNEIPPEDITCEEDLYNYPISEYEELYDLTVNEKWYDNKWDIQKICLELDESLLGEYINTRLKV